MLSITVVIKMVLMRVTIWMEVDMVMFNTIGDTDKSADTD